MKLSRLAQELSPSATTRITGLVRKLEAEGREIVDLCAGEPDFATPREICRAAENAIRQGRTRYTAVPGIIPLRTALADSYTEGTALALNSDNVIVTNGGKQALFECVQVTIDRGDEVIIPCPYWVSYPEMVRMAGGTPIPLMPANHIDWKISPEDLRKAITSRSRCLIINSPSNPSGAVYSKTEVMALLEVAIENGLFVIADDVYDRITYDCVHTCLIREAPELLQHVITINSFSKTYAMTGWRVGYAIGEQSVIKKMGAFQSQCSTNVNTIAQYAALEALNLGDSFCNDMTKEFRLRIHSAAEALKGSELIKLETLPSGAFYLFPDISGTLKSSGGIFEGSLELAEKLLLEAGVATVPGVAFGVEGAIRLSVSCSEQVIKEGISRIISYLEAALQS